MAGLKPAAAVPAPVYTKVPALKMRFAAEDVEAPRPLATPPSARFVTAKTPVLMTVAPV